jgi:catechol 2,3-dioxygenase-like lactoylglutathione lyase family enzyme
MAIYVGSIVINVANIERARRFWEAALGYVLRDADDEFVVLTDPKRRWANLSLQLLPHPKEGRNRLHLDLYADDQAAEVARLESLGSQRLAWNYPPGANYIVMADPDGNEFCVIDSSHPQD